MNAERTGAALGTGNVLQGSPSAEASQADIFLKDVFLKDVFLKDVFLAQRMAIVGQLTGGVVHDFNNILTVIAGTIEILAEAVAGQPELETVAGLN